MKREVSETAFTQTKVSKELVKAEAACPKATSLHCQRKK